MGLPSIRSNPYKSKKLWWERVKIIARLQLSRFPLIEIAVIRIWRISRWLLLRCKWKLLTFMGICSREIDIDKTFMVPPQRIKYCSLQEFNIHDFKGRIIAGDWDRLEKRFEDLDIYIALKQVCIDGKNWAETLFYKRILNILNRGGILWNCKNKDDFNQRCKDLQLLYQNIIREGYKSQREIMLTKKDYDPMNLEDEVTVNIGRHGDLLFSNSAHRLAIAKLLGIQKIPIKIAVRSSEWMKFKKELISYAKELGGKIPQLAIHPDLDDIPAHNDCEEIFMIIQRSMSIKNGRLLDIGAGFGYFCHRFEDEGFDCYALEDSLRNRYFLKKLKRAENKKFKIIDESILECGEIRDARYDIILALNTFHRFLKTKESYYKLINLLKSLQTEELFFVPCLLDEKQIENSYKSYNPDEFVDFILEVSRFKTAEFIGEARNGRKIYRLR